MINSEITQSREIWKPIQNYESCYQISTKGRVRSLKGNKKTILKPQPNSNGYLRVHLYKEGARIRVFVHRIVASTFIDNRQNEIYVDHKNRNRTDNAVINLRWCDIHTNLKNRKFNKNK